MNEATHNRLPVFRRLWARMTAAYHHRWTSALGETPDNDQGRLTLAAETWAQGLADVSDRQIGIGVAACIASADGWPPTLPEFRAYCLNVPSLAATRVEMLAMFRNPTMQPAPFLAAMLKSIDLHRMKSSPSEVADRMVREAYEYAREKVLRGEKLPEPVPVITREEPKGTPATEATARAALDACADLFKRTEHVPEPAPDAAVACAMGAGA